MSEPQKSRRGAWSWRYGTTAISEIRAKTWLRGPGPPAALEGAWYQAASFRGGRGKLRARDGHRGESAASFTWLHDRHGVNIFVSASYVGTGCRRAGPPPKAGPAQAAVDSATEAPESGWFLAYSSSLGRRVIGEIIPESCIHLCEEPDDVCPAKRYNRGQRFAVVHALGHHEMDLLIGHAAQLVVKRDRARSPARDVEQTVRSGGAVHGGVRLRKSDAMRLLLALFAARSPRSWVSDRATMCSRSVFGMNPAKSRKSRRTTFLPLSNDVPALGEKIRGNQFGATNALMISGGNR